jgi:hypothetical protein
LRTHARPHDVGPVVATRKIAIGEAEARNGTAETLCISLFEIEAGVEGHPANRRANGLTFDVQRAWRKRCIAHRASATNLDGSHDRAVIADSAGAARAIEARICEELAGNEVPSLIGIHWLGACRPCHKQAGHQDR